ncbi:MAG: PTS sugar transporter subunit IIC [bacterium]
MVEQILLISLIGSVFSLDVTFVGQMLLSRPLVLLTVFGFCFNAPVEGFTLGVILELICIDMLPLGVVIPLDAAIMSSITAGVFFIGVASPVVHNKTIAILFAFIVAMSFHVYDLWFKKKSSIFFDYFQAIYKHLDRAVTGVIVGNIIIIVIRNFVFIALSLGFACFLRDIIFTFLPDMILNGFIAFDVFLPLLSLVIAFNLDKFKKIRVW